MFIVSNKYEILSPLEILILSTIYDAEAMYGLDIVKKTEGIVKRGSVYVTLSRMVDHNLLTAKKQTRDSHQIGPTRVFYQISKHGVETLDVNIKIARLLRGEEQV